MVSLFVYEAALAGSAEETLSKIRRECPGATAIVVRRELGCYPLLYFSLFSGLKAFQDGKNSAHTVELEWICRLACEKNVSKALARTSADGKACAIASTEKLSSDVAKKIRIIREIPKDEIPKGDFLAKFYGISNEALKNYALADLAIEKMAVGFL